MYILQSLSQSRNREDQGPSRDPAGAWDYFMLTEISGKESHLQGVYSVPDTVPNVIHILLFNSPVNSM